MIRWISARPLHFFVLYRYLHHITSWCGMFDRINEYWSTCLLVDSSPTLDEELRRTAPTSTSEAKNPEAKPRTKTSPSVSSRSPPMMLATPWHLGESRSPIPWLMIGIPSGTDNAHPGQTGSRGSGQARIDQT